MSRLLPLLLLLICLAPACRAYLQLNATGYLSIVAITSPVTVSTTGYALMMKLRITSYQGRARFWDSGPFASTPATFPTTGTSYTCQTNGLTWALQAGSGGSPIPISDVQPAKSATCSSTQSSVANWVPLNEDVTVWISVGNTGRALTMHRNTISGGHTQFYANSALATGTFGDSAATSAAVAVLCGFEARVYEIAVWSLDQGLNNGGDATYNPNQAVPNSATSLRARYDFTTASTGTKTIPNVSSFNSGVDNLQVVGTGTGRQTQTQTQTEAWLTLTQRALISRGSRRLRRGLPPRHRPAPLPPPPQCPQPPLRRQREQIHLRPRPLSLPLPRLRRRRLRVPRSHQHLRPLCRQPLRRRRGLRPQPASVRRLCLALCASAVCGSSTESAGLFYICVYLDLQCHGDRRIHRW